MSLFNSKDHERIAELAMGRIFRMMSRPFQEGDVEEFYRCRDIVMSGVSQEPEDLAPNYARDRLMGAAGD